MTRHLMTPAATRAALDTTIRDQLTQAWQRGMDTAPRGRNAISDRGLPRALDAIRMAVDNHVTVACQSAGPDLGDLPPAAAAEDDIVIVHCQDTLTLPAGSHLRAIRCLACGQPAGGQPVTVFGVVALAIPACDCGRLESDLYLVHTAHWPMEYDALQTVVSRALRCGNQH